MRTRLPIVTFLSAIFFFVSIIETTATNTPIQRLPAGVDPTTTGQGTAVMIDETTLQITPEVGWYVSSVQISDTESINSLLADVANNCLYCTVATSESSVHVTFNELTAWDGTAKKPIGSATDDSYFIYTPAELAWVAQQAATNNFADKTFTLMNTLDLGGKNWAPIGNETTTFQGTFDGNYQFINNLTISGTTQNNVGLFGYIGTSGKVNNLAIARGQISGRNGVGSIAGTNAGSISQCFNMAEIIVAQDEVGGIVGANTGTISDVYNVGIIHKVYGNNAGGLVGINSGTISAGYNVAYLVSVAGSQKGALVGKNEGTLANLFFDEQMTLQQGIGAGANENATAKKTAEMYDIFNSNTAWQHAENFYPQLAGFASTNASALSVSPIFLTENDKAESITENFECQTNSGQVQWTSPAEYHIQISGANATVTRNNEFFGVYLTAAQGNFTKKVYVKVQSSDLFFGGAIKGAKSEYCFGETIETIESLSVATGGNGNYQYRWLCNGEIIATSNTLEYTPTTDRLEFGKQYVFRRQAIDNSGNTQWTFADDSVVVFVYKQLSAGHLGGVYENLCYDKKIGDYVDLPLTDSIAPEGGDGNYETRWILNYFWKKSVRTLNEDLLPITIQVDTASVDTIMSATPQTYFRLIPTAIADFAFPITYTCHREVRNMHCHQEWTQSEDIITYVVTSANDVNQIAYNCEDAWPLVYTYKYQDGTEQELTFQENGDSYTMDDLTPYGCRKTVVVTASERLLPIAKMDTVSVCQTDTQINISYQLIAGIPNRYGISFDKNAEKQGFAAIDNAPLSADKTIPIKIPADATAGTYEAYIQLRDVISNVVCESEIYTVPFTLDLEGYILFKWDDCIFVDNNNKNAFPSVSEDKKFTAYQWYKNGKPIKGATEQYYWEESGLNGFYFAKLVTTDGDTVRTCEIEKRPEIKTETPEGIACYPVPAKAGSQVSVRIAYNKKTPINGRLEVYNQMGMCIYSTNCTSAETNIRAALQPNMYLVRFVSTDGQVLTTKLIVR